MPTTDQPEVKVSHTARIISMLKSQPYVPISQLRMQFNYRSRISDCRPIVAKEGYNIKSVVIENNGRKFYAYRLVGLGGQGELF